VSYHAMRASAYGNGWRGVRRDAPQNRAGGA